MACVVSRAWLYAPCIRLVYVNVIDEGFEERGEIRCRRLNVSMHGTRDAASAAFIEFGAFAEQSSPLFVSKCEEGIERIHPRVRLREFWGRKGALFVRRRDRTELRMQDGELRI